MPALNIYAGPLARRHLEQHGLRPCDVRVVPGAAGGPKGLILGPLDRLIFGEWLVQSAQPVHLVGASIGAWRMATACLADPAMAFRRLEHDYIRQEYALAPGQKRPMPDAVSAQFGQSLQAFYAGQVPSILCHHRYRLHMITSRGRHMLGHEHRVATPLGYLGAFVTNALHRKAMGVWLERVVFSTPHASLPFATGDYRTRQVPLSEANFNPALQASCSIPFVLRAVHAIPGAPPGAYWDGGITDYHLHLDYNGLGDGLVLYPHFQRAVVPGWLDKKLTRRHRATHFLDRMLLLAPNPAWVRTLPRGKLPDRNDFMHYGVDTAARVKAWSSAVAEAQRLADEFAQWLERPDLSRVQAL